MISSKKSSLTLSLEDTALRADKMLSKFIQVFDLQVDDFVCLFIRIYRGKASYSLRKVTYLGCSAYHLSGVPQDANIVPSK